MRKYIDGFKFGKKQDSAENLRRKSNNYLVLEKFTEYCKEHPEQRFWQALRNWSQVGYVWVSDAICRDPNCVDTFYWVSENEKPRNKKRNT